MKLVHAMLEKNIVFEENKINVLVIEQADFFSKSIRELLRQIQGEQGDFVLSEAGKGLGLKKCAEMIINPFSMDFSQKKLLSALYKEAEKAALDEQLFVSTKEVQGMIARYLQRLCDELIYPACFDEEISIPNLLKYGNFRIEMEFDSMLESVVEYMKLAVNLLHTKLFIFVNMKTYLGEEELEAFYQMIKNEKFNVLLIERGIAGRREDEDICLVDKDLCEI
ncbi:MAG: type II-A CRISPR-associated protein Csn2 [Lachnospiraceae bacterium]|nr:type II-A CRISPR-associated protein Csn2 [Lachnospiraceae bacterium]